ncbi:hypothetical protein MAR_023485, partial [Mya arenaria]
MESVSSATVFILFLWGSMVGGLEDGTFDSRIEDEYMVLKQLVVLEMDKNEFRDLTHETDTVNSYDTTNGMFTAHVDRFYFLAITIHSAVNSYVGAEIVVNGVVKGEAFADSEEIADTHSSSAMTIVRMSAREEAYVRRGSDRGMEIGTFGSRFEYEYKVLKQLVVLEMETNEVRGMVASLTSRLE